MSIVPNQSPEEQANEKRTVKDGGGKEHHGLIDAIEQSFQTLANPLVHSTETAAERKEQREANDEATRDDD